MAVTLFAGTIAEYALKMSLGFTNFAFNATIFITLTLYLINSEVDIVKTVN